MSKKNEVMKQETNLPAEMGIDAWGVPEVTSNDIIIPKVLAMQGLSELVAEGHAQMGEFRNSVSGDLLGSIDKPMEFIPFHCEKVWIISEKPAGAGRHEYKETLPVTRENEDWQWQDITEDGTEVRRDRTMNFYVLRPEDIENDMPMPYIITFNRTSARNGKKLYTQMFVTNRMAKKAPPAKVMLLTGKREKNDQGTFIVKDVRVSRDSTQKEVTACFEMFQTVKAGNTKVDNADLSDQF